MTDINLKELAKLARLRVSDEELQKLEEEIPSILRFVEVIQKAPADAKGVDDELHNVMREDGEPHESGFHTEKLLKAAPKAKDGRIVVKQVISRLKS